MCLLSFCCFPVLFVIHHFPSLVLSSRDVMAFFGVMLEFLFIFCVFIMDVWFVVTIWFIYSILCVWQSILICWSLTLECILKALIHILPPCFFIFIFFMMPCLASIYFVYPLTDFFWIKLILLLLCFNLHTGVRSD